MYKVRSIDYLMDTLKILADNPDSLLWRLADDVEFNGHVVSVKGSNQFNRVVIDGRYEPIGGVGVVVVNDVRYEPLDYVRALLLDEVDFGRKAGKESMDFGKGSNKEIREAIARKAVLKEGDAIKVYNRNSTEYERLEAAAQLLTTYTGKEHYVGETYFDHGQDWKWTTVLCTSKEWGATQALTPRDQEDIVMASTPGVLGKAVDRVISKS